MLSVMFHSVDVDCRVCIETRDDNKRQDPVSHYFNLRFDNFFPCFFSHITKRITMSAPTMPDIFEKVWKEFIKDKVKTEDGVSVPRPEGPPKVSFSALPGGPQLDGPVLTWKSERMLSGHRPHDPRIINDILISLVPDDNMEQLEKIYQHEYANAMMHEYWNVRLESVKVQWEEWKHVAAKAGEDLAAVESGDDEVATAMQYAILDRAQGRVIHWSKVVAQEEARVQRQETRLTELARPALEAIVLLEKRHEANVGWFVLAYSATREDASVSVCGLRSYNLPKSISADY